jgi:hypothetical protein
MKRTHFFFFLAATLFLLFIIAFNSFIEPLTIGEADALTDVIFKDDASEYSIKDVESLNIKDENILFILKSEISNQEKLVRLKSYMCELVSNRNDLAIYDDVPPQEKLTCKDFIKILNFVGSKDSEYNIDYPSKINEFRSLLLNDTAYNDVLNSEQTDEEKFIGSAEPNLVSLTNEVLFAKAPSEEEEEEEEIVN